jgi:hypothetical protein
MLFCGAAKSAPSSILRGQGAWHALTQGGTTAASVSDVAGNREWPGGLPRSSRREWIPAHSPRRGGWAPPTLQEAINHIISSKYHYCPSFPPAPAAAQEPLVVACPVS